MEEHSAINDDAPPLRPLAHAPFSITPVAMGCWPIAGITSMGTSPEQSRAALRAAFDAGIRHFDTAFVYGYNGESERLIGETLGPVRDQITIASKGGLYWEGNEQQADGSAERLKFECEESLRRLGTDVIDLYYLHFPDPERPVAESAATLRELLDSGKIRAVGVSNFKSIQQYDEFAAICPIAADQQPYNMLQRDIERDRLQWCRAHDVAVMAYWPLMKGFLAGKLRRDHVFPESDSRRNYRVFQGEQWEKTHDFLDRLRPLAENKAVTIAQLVIAWTIAQPGITCALCGAKFPEQIEETAAAMHVQLTQEDFADIEDAIVKRGPVAG